MTMKTRTLFSILGTFTTILLFTGCVFDSINTVNGGDAASGKTIKVTVGMPEDTPQTRISLEQDGLAIKLAWQVGDEVHFLFTQNNENKGPQVVTLSAADISPDGKKATFTLNIPSSISDGEFNLYGVYGGGGPDSENPRLVKLPTVAQSTSSSLKEIEKNKAMVLVFSQENISYNDPDIMVAFKHIGSLFSIQVKNTGTTALDKVTEARLTASTAIPAYSNSGAETYDITTGAFSGTHAAFLTFFPVSSSNVVSEGILEFWAWVPMNLEGNTEVAWPALGLEIMSNGSPITATTTKGARNATVGKTYHLYATHNGSALTFATAAEMTVDADKVADFRDGYLYNTVTIGSQIWMAENLKYLPSVVGPETGTNTVPYYYVYDYNGTDVAAAKATANYKTYGVLYNWPAAMNGAGSSTANPSQVQGVCPAGWHLPSDVEWTQLENYLADNGHNYDGTTGGGGSKIAKSLASASGWDSYSGTGAVGNTDYPAYRNKSGFSALPGGYRSYDGAFNTIGYSGHWWSSPEGSTDSAWYRTLYYSYSYVLRSNDGKEHGFSVRCVRD